MAALRDGRTPTTAERQRDRQLPDACLRERKGVARTLLQVRDPQWSVLRAHRALVRALGPRRAPAAVDARGAVRADDVKLSRPSCSPAPTAPLPSPAPSRPAAAAPAYHGHYLRVPLRQVIPGAVARDSQARRYRRPTTPSTSSSGATGSRVVCRARMGRPARCAADRVPPRQPPCVAWLNHYRVKSAEEWEGKKRRGQADAPKANSALPRLPFTDWHGRRPKCHAHGCSWHSSNATKRSPPEARCCGWSQG